MRRVFTGHRLNSFICLSNSDGKISSLREDVSASVPLLRLIWINRCDFADDARGHVGLFEVAVLGVEDDLAVEEVEDMDFELGREGDGEPDAVRLRGVADGEAEAGNVGSEESADGERNLARHAGGKEDG